MKLKKLIREYSDFSRMRWLEELARDIKKILPNIDIEIFEIGYGLTFKFNIFNKPGHVGLEDQQMPYISIRKNNYNIWSIEPDYFSKAFGDVSMPEKMKNDAKKYILKYFSVLKNKSS